MNNIESQDFLIRELAAGYAEKETSFNCHFCDHQTQKGRIYEGDESLVDAELAMQGHIVSSHGSAFNGLLDWGRKGTGLSDTQLSLLELFWQGLTDKEIQPRAGNISLSTIRNHRFQLRNKAKQARAFLALMSLLEADGQDSGQKFIDIPGQKSADDERFAITRSEYRKIIATHFPEGLQGKLVRFPKKEKRKIAVLIHILDRFTPGQRYSQKQVNQILTTVADDYTTLCRYLVDYGFLGRTRDGSEYWLE